MECHHGQGFADTLSICDAKLADEPWKRCELINGLCRNKNGTSFYGDSCEYLEPILKCSEKSISLHIESLNHEKYSRLVY